MNNIAIHSIRPLAEDAASHGWRIASAVVPAATAELTVTREEVRELSPARVLLLETVRLLEQEGGRAKVTDLANFSGICDEALMAGILVPLADQGLVLIDGECVRQNPALTIDGDQARIVVEREEQVCVIGSPPVPGYGIDHQRLKKLRAFDADIATVPVGEAVLEDWRAEFWDARTHRLQLREPLQPRLYVLEGSATGDGVLELRDEKHNVRVNLPAEHPFLRQLLAEVRPILDAAPALLTQFGTWDAEQSELSCTGEQWRRWCAAQGSDFSEVILRGNIDVAIAVLCRPADTEAARAMLLENVVEELDANYGPCTDERVKFLTDRQRQSHLLRGHDLPTPTLTEVESVAWDSGRWELAYRIAGTADGL